MLFSYYLESAEFSSISLECTKVKLSIFNNFAYLNSDWLKIYSQFNN